MQWATSSTTKRGLRWLLVPSMVKVCYVTHSIKACVSNLVKNFPHKPKITFSSMCGRCLIIFISTYETKTTYHAPLSIKRMEEVMIVLSLSINSNFILKTSLFMQTTFSFKFAYNETICHDSLVYNVIKFLTIRKTKKNLNISMTS